jgi:hypothetical protein
MIVSENRFPLFRIMHARTRGPSLPGWGDRTGSNVLPRPRKPGLELRPRAECPDGKSRSGTPIGERTRWCAPRPLPTLPRKRERGKRQGRGGWRHTSVGVPLPFFLSSLRFVGWVERSETHAVKPKGKHRVGTALRAFAPLYGGCSAKLGRISVARTVCFVLPRGAKPSGAE